MPEYLNGHDVLNFLHSESFLSGCAVFFHIICIFVIRIICPVWLQAVVLSGRSQDFGKSSAARCLLLEMKAEHLVRLIYN